MTIYLAKKEGKVICHTDLAAMEQLDGIKKADKTVTIEEWEAAGSTAHINSLGKITLGEEPTEKAQREEIATLEADEKNYQKELDSKDYKVIKASETGQVLAQTDPSLHQRREVCRSKINEIRARLVELGVKAAE